MEGISEDVFVPGREKKHLTRREKRIQRQQHRGEDEDVDTPEQVLDMSAAEKLQDEDATLLKVREAADGHPCSAGVGFFRREGLLYRKWTPPGRNEEEMEVEQLVLPKACRETMMKLAHEIPLAGHMVKEKTRRRILQRFYWPTLYKDAQEHCRACEQCQKSTSRRVQQAPLIPLPIVGEPFRKTAMDIVGPLPQSRAGNRYVLVICDYATRYPEAIPLKSIDAEHVAEELINVFA